METRRIVIMSTSTVVVVTAILFPLGAMGGPVLHKVGGSKGWINHDVNYTQWSAREHVFLGDWLRKY